MVRRSSNDNEAIANVLRLLPAKWLIGLLVAVVLYFFLQPKLNQWFGWGLPSIAAMAGNEPPAKTSRVPSGKSDATGSAQSSSSKSSATARSNEPTKSARSSNDSTSKDSANKSQAGGQPSDDDYKYRILKPLGAIAMNLQRD